MQATKMVAPSMVGQLPVPQIYSARYTLTGLVNIENYYKFTDFVTKPDEIFKINVNDIVIDNYEEYYRGLFNVILDGVKSTLVSDKFIKIYFTYPEQEEMSIELSAIDLLFNIIFWYIIIRTDRQIKPSHIIWDERHMTQNTIKNFFDDYAIEDMRKRYSNREVNNILNDCLDRFGEVDIFSPWTMQTINLTDNLDLMRTNPEFKELLHADLSNVPIEDVTKVGMDLTNRAIEIILNSKEYMGYEHCLINSFRSGEGINKKQYKEFSFHEGTKPDGEGGVFPVPINSSLLNGGLRDPLYYLIDSHAGRTAQILSKINVGDSGSFARILALNNSDSFLCQDPNYDCHSKNYQIVDIKSEKILRLLHKRYARFHPNGMEFVIDRKDTTLIGKRIYLRSPMTCASASRGLGICYKCYGDLAYTNSIFNIGRIASDIISSRLTQRLLSAKHLLQTVINSLMWSDGFEKYFEVEYNTIKVSSSDENPLKNVFIEIDPEEIKSSNEFYSSDDDDDDESSFLRPEFNEYINSFNLIIGNNPPIPIHTLPDEKGNGGFDNLYISNELNGMIRRKGMNNEGMIRIPLASLEDEYIFFITIHNNELSKAMKDIMSLINKGDITKSYNKDELLQKFLETVIDGDLYVSSVHCEIILSNQLRDAEDVLEKPDWSEPNAPYQVFTLNDALTNNPSIIVTLMYQRIARTIFAPLSFRKRGASFLDLFFMKQPGMVLEGDSVVEGLNPEKEKIIREQYGFIVDQPEEVMDDLPD